MNETRSLARFVCNIGESDFPALARSRAVDAITDCVACMLAGSRESLAAMVLDVVAASEGANGMTSPLVGARRFSTPVDSALYNGAIAHALDYDDTNHPGYAHVSAVIVPVMFALWPQVQATGRSLVTAYVIGLEVIGKLGRALNPAHLKQGWHPTSTFGTLAATGVAARLLRLSEEQTLMALGIGASAAAGWRGNFGTMTKPLHAGYAARNGVLAALLARRGYTATDTALEHRYGYCNILNHGTGCDFGQLACWGNPLEILTDYGLALKPYPSCGATHPGIEAALLLHREIGNEPIVSVRAGVSELAFEPLIYVMPNTPLAGKFSLHYCIAAALVDGVVNLRTFTEARFGDPKIRSLIDRISMEADDRVRRDPEFATIVTVQTASGAYHERQVPLAIGKPQRWFSESLLREKFMDCAQGFSTDGASALYGTLRSLDGAMKCTTLLEALSVAVAKP